MRNRITARMACALVFVAAGMWSSASQAEGPENGRPVGTHVGGIASVHYSPDGQYLASGGGDKKIRVWEARTGRLVHEWDGPSSFTCAVRFSPDGNLVAAAGYESGSAHPIHVYDRGTGKPRTQLKSPTAGGIRRLVFSPDGKSLISAGFDGHLRVWDLSTMKEIVAIKVEAGSLYDLALSPDGRMVATAGRDGLRLWDLSTGREQPRDEMKKHGCITVAYSPDGKLLASGDQNSVKIWEVMTGKEVVELTGFRGEVSQLLFSGDSRRLYSSSYDRMVRLWNVLDGEMLGEIEAHSGWVWGIALNKGETKMASCSVDTKLLVWDLGRSFRSAGGSSKKLTPGQLESHCTHLASTDAPTAYQAIRALTQDPDQSLPAIRKRLLAPQPSSGGTVGENIGQWIRDLDADSYSVREEASARLARMGVSALPSLEKALAHSPSLEARKRLRRLVSRLDPTELASEELMTLRSVQALEYMATPEARRLLEQLSGSRGNPLASGQAVQALNRIRDRADR